MFGFKKLFSRKVSLVVLVLVAFPVSGSLYRQQQERQRTEPSRYGEKHGGMAWAEPLEKPKEIFRFPPGATLLDYSLWAGKETVLILERKTGWIQFLEGEGLDQEGVVQEITLRPSEGRIVWAACYDPLNQRLALLECSRWPYTDEDGSLEGRRIRLFVRTVSIAGETLHPLIEIDPADLFLQYYGRRGGLDPEMHAKLEATRYHFWPGRFEWVDAHTVALGVEDIPSLFRGVLIFSLEGQLRAYSGYADQYSFAIRNGSQGWEATVFKPGNGLFRLGPPKEEPSLWTPSLLGKPFSYLSPVGFLSQGDLVVLGSTAKKVRALVLDGKGQVKRQMDLPGNVRSTLNCCFVRRESLVYLGRNKRQDLVLVELPLGPNRLSRRSDIPLH